MGTQRVSSEVKRPDALGLHDLWPTVVGHDLRSHAAHRVPGVRSDKPRQVLNSNLQTGD